MNKGLAILCICIFFGGLLTTGLSGKTGASGLAPLVYTFDTPIIEKVRVNDEVFDNVIVDGATSTGDPGEPCLPIMGANILLPPKTEVTQITASPSGRVNLGTGFNLLTAGIPSPIAEYYPDSPGDIIKKDKKQTGSSEETLFTEVGTYYFRGYGILILQLHPVHYTPETGKLYFYKEITVSVKTSEKSGLNSLYRGLYNDEIQVKEKVDNPEVALKYRNQIAQPIISDRYDLLIVTTSKLAWGFRPLETHHKNNGINTIVKTYNELGETVSPEDIRTYIRDAYSQWGIEYVLIGGDDDIIPGPQLWVSGLDEETTYYDTIMPSDLFYGCLDGPYNFDGDDRWGEPNDGENGGDVDLMAEVYIGRACVSTEEEANNFVSKTRGYVTATTDDYLNDVLMAAEILDSETYGADYMDELIEGSSHYGYDTVGISSQRFNITTLYDRDWPDGHWPKSEIQSNINRGVHILNHLGHSNYGYALRMSIDDIADLTNEKYCFIYSQGCNAGGFDAEDCIAEYLTVKSEYGAFAVIMNARYGFYWHNSTDGDNQHYMREFWDAVFRENIPVISKANQDSKEDNLYLIGRSMMRWCYYQLNLFGDPTVALHISTPPAPPISPVGETKIDEDIPYTYTTRTTDAENDLVYYMWDWDDNSPDTWLGPYPSGTMVNATHTWEEKGSYNIRVKAKDINGMESDWSDPLRVDVTKNLPWALGDFFVKILKLFLSFMGLEISCAL